MPSAGFVIAGHRLPGDAGSATWNLNPGSGDWNTAANWTPATVPNAADDIATFDASDVTDLGIRPNVEVSGIVFNPTASSYRISTSQGLTFAGTGITNNSGVTQSFLAAAIGFYSYGYIFFDNSATAGTQTAFTCQGSHTPGFGGANVYFSQNSNAGSASFTVEGGEERDTVGGDIFFLDDSSEANAVFAANGGQVKGSVGGFVDFLDTSTAANSIITTSGGAGGRFQAQTTFSGTATADHATFINNTGASSTALGGALFFFENATAGNANVTNNGSNVSGGRGGVTGFVQTSTGENGTFNNNGGTASGALGGRTEFVYTSSSGNATLIANAHNL